MGEDVLEKIYDEDHNINPKKLSYYCTKTKLTIIKLLIDKENT